MTQAELATPAQQAPSPPRASSAPSRFQIEGIVKTVTFHNDENGYTIFQLQSGLYETAVAGITVGIHVGEKARCIGVWQETQRYGRQFKAESIHLEAPDERDALLRYLSSGVIPGIGRHFAGTLLEHFGTNVFTVLDEHPEQIAALPGIGKKRLDSILSSRKDQKAQRDILLFLYGHGLGGLRAAKVYRKYGSETIKKLSANPYLLATEMHGFGFQIADEFARRLGISATSPERLAAGLEYTLEQEERSGHCTLTEPQLLTKASALLTVDQESLEPALAVCMAEARLKLEMWDSQRQIYRPALFYAERAVSRLLRRLQQGPLPWGGLPPRTDSTSKVVLSDSQKQALAEMLRHKVAILAGGPGVGKTTITRNLLYQVNQGTLRILLCAPTGKAAKRLSESTGLEARTVHRMLEYGPSSGFARNQQNPLEADLVILDEASMIDIELMAALLEALPAHAGLWLVGDPDQLPSVGPGAVLYDLIASGQLPVVRLTEIFRQALSSQIIVNAHKIVQGQIPVKQVTGETTDFYLFSEEDSDRIPGRLLDIVTRKIPDKFGFDPLTDIQVLTPMRKGPLGADMLATRLQEALFPDSRPEFRFGPHRFALGDKVMQVVNNYEKAVFNGESGFITEILLQDKLLKVDFDGRLITYSVSDLDELILAYALSIHKSQGSEYPAVVIPLTTQHYTLLERNLLYTGVTRGKQLVVLIGQAKALAQAVKTHRAGKRSTTLQQRLQAGVA